METEPLPRSKGVIQVDTNTFTQLAEEARSEGIGPSTLVRMWILERLRERAGRRQAS